MLKCCELQAALKQSQPSSKREGFATVPNVTWDHIGALQSVHRELQKSIIVCIIVCLIAAMQYYNVSHEWVDIYFILLGYIFPNSLNNLFIL